MNSYEHQSQGLQPKSTEPTKPPPEGRSKPPPASLAQDPAAVEASELTNRRKRIEPISRRRFVKGFAVTSLAAAGFAGTSQHLARRPAQNPLPVPRSNSGSVPKPSELASVGLDAAPVDQRILVLVELEGGNDGLSTVIPRNVGTYYDLRPQHNFAEEELLPFDEEIGLNPNLLKLSKRPLTIFEGVGPINGDLSHFEMVKRWEQGDMEGSGTQRSGFLARLVDGLRSESPMKGLSVSGHTPRFNAAKASVLSLDGPHQLNVLTNDDWIYPTYRNALQTFTGGPMTSEMNGAWHELFAIGDSLRGDLEEFDDDDPMIADGGNLGRQLKTAASLIASDVGVRVIHARLGGFDTHEGHDYKHMELMKKVDAAVAGFLSELELAGYADRVLLATTSDFGRRLKENNGGFDHGSASTMLLSGPIKAGRLGEPSPLNALDDDGNLKTTVGFDRYLATLAQSWLGVEAASILPNNPQPFDLL